MRINRTLLFGALMLGLSASAWAQAPDISRPPLPAPIDTIRPPGSVPNSDGSSPSQAGGLKFHRPMTHVLGLASAQPWRVGSMKLLAPGVGWAKTNHGLLWTENGGADWKAITLPTSTVQIGADVGGPNVLFFLNTHQGWALLGGCGADHPQKLDLELDLMSTTDSGVNWSRTHVTPPSLLDYGNPDGIPIQGCRAKVAFADSLHGWISVTVQGETMNSFWSFLLVTSDGGRTWKQARRAPSLEDASMLLVTPSEGWLLGSSREDPYQELYVTYDGAGSWQQVLVRAPKELSPATETGYELPVFLDSRHGYLAVNYSYSDRGNDIGSEVLFATDDGGKTWNPDRIVKNMTDSTRLQSSSSTVVDSNWIFASVSDHHPILTKLGVGERIDASVGAAAGRSSYYTVRDLSFVTPTQGWVKVGNGQLLSTTDGGSTWADITPGPKLRGAAEHSSLLPQSMENTFTSAPPVNTSPSGSLGLNLVISKHLGFDADCNRQS